MKLAIIGLASLASLGFAHPAAASAPATEADYSQWMAPIASDSRSPCPAMNSLANHGAINRNGRNITYPDLLDAFSLFLNAGADSIATSIGPALDTNDNPQTITIDLDKLQKHGVIEHDTSLSRFDTFLGNNTVFHLPYWESVLSTLEGEPNFSVASMERARNLRVADSIKNNPNVTYTEAQYFGGMFEAAVGMAVMSNPIDANPSAAYMTYWFENERFPNLIGWKKSPITITFASIVSIAGRMQQSGGTGPFTEGNFTMDTLRSVYNGQQLQGFVPCYMGGNPCT